MGGRLKNRDKRQAEHKIIYIFWLYFGYVSEIHVSECPPPPLIFYIYIEKNLKNSFYSTNRYNLCFLMIVLFFNLNRLRA